MEALDTMEAPLTDMEGGLIVGGAFAVGRVIGNLLIVT